MSIKFIEIAFMKPAHSSSHQEGINEKHYLSRNRIKRDVSFPGMMVFKTVLVMSGGDP